MERAFSKGGVTVSRFRHSLTDDSTRASAVLGSWIGLEGVVQREVIEALFKEKKSRKGAKRQKTDHPTVIEVNDDD